MIDPIDCFYTGTRRLDEPEYLEQFVVARRASLNPGYDIKAVGREPTPKVTALDYPIEVRYYVSCIALDSWQI